MMKVRFAVLGTIGVTILALGACGGDDSATTTPSDDGGSDATPDQTTGIDATSQDTGADTASDTSTSDVTDGGAASDAPTDGPRTLDGALCDGGAIAVTKVDPVFGYTGGSTPVAITGSGFTATPKVYLRNNATQALTPIAHAAYVSQTSMTAIVPSGTPVATYDIGVANPDGCAAYLPNAFRVVSNPPPTVVSVSPAAGTTQVNTDVTVTGCHFPTNVTLSTVNPTGTVAPQTAQAATCNGPTNVCADGSPLCTFTGTIDSTTLGVGVYLVRASNPADQDWGDYASFVVTNPAQKLSGQWGAGPALNTGRRSLGLVAGRIDDANRFLYAVGGESAAGTALASVEVAPLDKFGQAGKWFVQRNALNVARSGLVVVRQGKYLYAIGGTSATDGTKGTAPTGAPLGSIERARILDPSQAPVVQDPPTASTSAGSLAAGTWYYKVSALVTDPDNPNGETLPSDEVIATLSAAGQVTLNWTAVPNATSYRIYRSPSANGTSQSETLIATGVSGTSYVDTGAAPDAAAEVPLATGSTGVWVPQSTALLHARSNSAGVVAPDGLGGLNVYLVGGWGSCTGSATNSVMSCAEATSINAAGDTLGATFAAVGPTGLLDGGAGIMTARMRHGIAALTSSNEPADAGTGATFLVVGGGYGPGIGSGAVEYASITAGLLGSWQTANATFSDTRDGTQIAIVNGEAYDFMGGTAPNQYKSTGFLSSLGAVSTTSVSFGSWSSNASPLPSSAVLGRFGLSVESAYFYVVGGTSNDTDALTSVYQILY